MLMDMLSPSADRPLYGFTRHAAAAGFLFARHDRRKRRCRLRRPAVRTFMALDALLRRCTGVKEFTHDPRCLLRIAEAQARRTLSLSDGPVASGAPVLEIHLWNERVPLVPGEGVSFGWARQMRQGTTDSLRVLALWLASPASPPEAVAIRACTAFAAPGQGSKIVSVMRGFGFEAVPRRRFPVLQAIGQLWADLYVSGLVFAFNPPCLSTRKLRRERCEFWISRERLIARYAPEVVGSVVEPAAPVC